MRARLVRLAFATHRWLGVALGLLMLMWCLSGFVMIWVGYPAITGDGRDFRVEGLAPLRLATAPVFPTAIPANARIDRLRLEMLADRPVVHIAWTGGSGVFDLRNGEEIDQIREREALLIAQTYADQHGIIAEPEIKTLTDRDEFVVAGYFNAGRPYWQVRLNDAAGTMLYVASTTGDIRQRTTTSLRFWNWLGAIPHWMYFTELRQNGPLWTNVIIWTSLGGCFLVVLGGFIGLRQFRVRATTGKRDSPYRGAKYWHHITGLVAGVIVLAWSFSGFTSMQPWGWLSTGSAASTAARQLPGPAPTWGVAQSVLRNQLAAASDEGAALRSMTSARHDGRLYMMWNHVGGRQDRRTPVGDVAVFETSDWVRAGEILSGGGAFGVERLEEEDEYYYKGAAAGRLPVVRVTTAADQTRYYIDPVTGQITAIADDGAKGYRWLHLALHRIDFASWVRARPVWDLAVILFLLPATLICALGAWLGLKKLARGGRLDGRPEKKP